MKHEKVYVYIGRFQMAHEAHSETIKHAMKNADRVVILVGSSELARDERNPFTFEERASVLESIASRHARDKWDMGVEVKFNVLPIHDYVYDNNKWLAEVHAKVMSVTNSKNITLTGCKKANDKSTVYLDIFPQWKKDFINEVQLEVEDDLFVTVNSTALRKQFFSTKNVPQTLPSETIRFLENFKMKNPDIFENLVKEFHFNQNYRAQMNSSLPYNTIPFLTGDALVTCAGHVLIIKRRTYPGKGLYALPGGFFDGINDQSQTDTAIRELIEETKIDVPEKVLRGSVVKVDEFGDKTRDPRWRIITRCVHIQLPDHTLPKVKGSDDAEKAFWMPLGDIVANRDKFFSDHLSIIDTFISVV